MTTKRTLAEAAGWYGVAAILAAYALSNFGMLAIDSTAYRALNLTGSIGIIWDAWTQKNWQPAVLNIVWAAIALFGLAQSLLR
jgi:hypothetical protein